jgi:NAD(P)-dependent dehydrogenase (short-subunit alcohol dehydrogenase family)
MDQNMSVSSQSVPKVWFITGCSSGFGRALAEAALAAGDSVVATARRPEVLAEWVARAPARALALSLGVTEPQQVESAVAAAIARFGRLDVVVNNAGYGLLGAVEECDEAQIRRCFETNFFGALNVIRAVLPRFREQRAGHLVNITAAAAIANYAGFGAYGAAKAALEALSESVRAETALLGIKVTLVEPGPFRTEFIHRSLERATNRLADYDRTSGKFAAVLKAIDGKQPGDPARAAAALVEMVRSGKAPFRMPLGRYMVKKLRDRGAELTRAADEGEAVAVSADFPAGA